MKQRLVTAVALAAILALGAGLRLWRFGAIEALTSDEAMYLRHARFVHAAAGWALGLPRPVADPSREGLWRHARRADWDSKPCWLHAGFVAAWMGLTGVGSAAGRVQNAVFSLAAALLLYFVARRFSGRTASLFASAMLAVSFYWMIYSRGQWAEVDAAFFALLAFLLALVFLPREKGGWFAALAAGAAAGVGGLCHYRYLTAALPLGVAAIAVGERRTVVAKTALVGVGFAAVLLAFDGALRLALLAAGPGVPFGGYLAALREMYLPGIGTVKSQSALQPLNVAAYLYYFLRNHGVAAAALTVAGLLPFAWRGRGAALRPLAAAAGFAGISLAMLTLQIWIVARGACVAIPFVCLLAANGLDGLLRMAGRRAGPGRAALRATAAVLAAAALVENVVADARFARNEMGHRRVAAFLSGARPQRVFVDPESVHFYAWHAPDLPWESDRLLRAGLDSMPLAGTYAVFDAEKYHAYPQRWGPLGELESRVKARGELVFECPNLTAAWRQFLMDGTQAHTLDGMLDSLRRAEGSDITSIRVYRLTR